MILTLFSVSGFGRLSWVGADGGLTGAPQAYPAALYV